MKCKSGCYVVKDWRGVGLVVPCQTCLDRFDRNMAKLVRERLGPESHLAAHLDAMGRYMS